MRRSGRRPQFFACRSHQGNDYLRQDDQRRYYERGTAVPLIYESLSSKWQDRRIGELKQEQADAEN